MVFYFLLPPKMATNTQGYTGTFAKWNCLAVAVEIGFYTD
jgi:hypothetical protein